MIGHGPGYLASGWNPTGHHVEISVEMNRVPEFDPRVGDHLWIMLTAFKVDPSGWRPENPPMLDQENMLSVSGPGCYYCERGWDARLARRRCKGKP